MKRITTSFDDFYTKLTNIEFHENVILILVELRLKLCSFLLYDLHQSAEVALAPVCNHSTCQVANAGNELLIC